MQDGPYSASERRLLLDGRSYGCRPGETVLEALLRQGVEVPNSCRRQICQTCMLRSLSGPPPQRAQVNIRESLKLEHCFLSCGCLPERDMEIAFPTAPTIDASGTQVVSINRLSGHVLEIGLFRAPPLLYRGGQLLTLVNKHQIDGSFPISSPTSSWPSGKIEIHVGDDPASPLALWIHSHLAVGDTLSVRGVAGELHYELGSPRDTLILISWGHGLGAMVAVMQDAFENKHTGQIVLIHAIEHRGMAYLVQEIEEVESLFPNFRYVPCAGEKWPDQSGQDSSVQAAVAEHARDLSHAKVFVCGPGSEVRRLQRELYFAGVALKNMRNAILDE